MDIKDILSSDMATEQKIAELKQKSIEVPSWAALRREYDPGLHEVMDKARYPDIIGEGNLVTPVTRVAVDYQRLAVKRTTELCFGIPVKRVYKTKADDATQQEVVEALEAIFQRCRIDSLNIERGRMLFAGCEVMTMWYGIKQDNTAYGFPSKLKMRALNFSPMLGDKLYPLFDEYGDMVAMSVEYTRNRAGADVTYFDAFTAERHIRWNNAEGWDVDMDEEINIGKIPAIYVWRPTPVWDGTTTLVNEIEWALSRNGNYLRENSRPIIACFADDAVQFGDSPDVDKAAKDVMQLPSGARLEYITWPAAIENLKYYVGELRQMFFTQLQLPDWSYESMKTTPMSGEARKQMFIDAQLKVKDESGRWLEFFDREVNVVKAFLKQMRPEWVSVIDQLEVENVITPYAINDEMEEINKMSTLAGGKQLISQRTAIERLDYVDDVDAELLRIAEENAIDALGM